jgi:CheY-like chemotaxis protein
MKRSLVLVVDDQEANRSLCREALELHGYEVVAAGGVREAEEYLLQNHPELRGRFIFMTGSPGSYARVSKLPDVAQCLLKPFSIRSLAEALKAALGS